MRAPLVVALLAGLAVAGCAGPAPTPAANPSPTTAGTDISACFDGDCSLAVSGPVDVPVDARFGFPALSVTELTAARLRFEVHGRSGGRAVTTTGPGGTSTLRSGGDALTVHVRSISSGVAVIELSS